jgi:uncharacterized protein YkwD
VKHLVTIVATFITTFFLTAILIAFLENKYLEEPSLDGGFQPWLAKEITAEVNNYRRNKGMNILVEDPVVCDLAIVRSIEAEKEFNHNKFLERFEYGTYKRFMKPASMGENMSENYRTGKEVLDAWINSPKHKEILEKETDYGCVSCYNYYCVLNTLDIL